MKKIATLLISLILLFALAGCESNKIAKDFNEIRPDDVTTTSKDAGKSQSKNASKKFEYGNTTGNISNGSLATMYKDSIFYSNSSQICKASLNWSNDIPIELRGNTNYLNCINVLNDYIYYVNDSKTLSRIKVDSSDFKILDSAGFGHSIMNVSVENDYVYYSEYYNIKRISIDGTDKNTIVSGDAELFNIYKGKIYYTSRDNDDGLYTINTDGSDNKKLSADRVGMFNVVGDWIFYINISDELIYKMKIDGSEKTKLCDDKTFNINATDLWVYYTNNSDDGRIYKISTNGENKSKITSGDSKKNGYKITYSDLNVINDWIMCNKRIGESNYGTIKIKVDGSNESKINYLEK